MSRRKQRAGATSETAGASLDAMRAALRNALVRLIADAKTNPDPRSETAAIERLLDAWQGAALAMINAAAGAVASDQVKATRTQSIEPDALHAAMLASLALIIEAARADRPDLDESCLRFADTYVSCLRDAVAAAHLWAATAVEHQLGLPAGLPN